MNSVPQHDREDGTGSCGLVLPGGGARGAYQVGVLQAIRELRGDQQNPFPVICGTSAGAINAAVLASHAHEFGTGIQRLEQFWGNMYCGRIYRTDPWSVFSSGMRLALRLLSGGLLKIAPRSLLNNAPLEQFLGETLQLQGIQTAIEKEALIGVAVTAAGYSSAAAISFYQGSDTISPWARPRRRGQPQELEVAHLLASSALPILFPAQRLGNEYFGDGGMRMVAPLSPAIHLGADRILVIGTRDEKPDPEPQVLPPYPSQGEIAGYLLDTIFMDTLQADLARLHRINRTLSLVPEAERKASGLKHINTLVIKPSQDLRDITARHAGSIPPAVRMLLRTMGGWGRDWRMASYLLFDSAYCQELMKLGYSDAMNQETQLQKFLGGVRPARDPG